MGEPSQCVYDDVVCEFHVPRTVYASCSYLVASEPREYLKHIMKSTNMSCLTPEGAMAGDSDFLSANMYARSLFGACLSYSSLATR
jgi:coatomer beta subunit-like protein